MTTEKTLLRGMPYTPSDRTDIRITWAKAGWKPKEQQPLRNTEKDYEMVQRQDWIEIRGFR